MSLPKKIAFNTLFSSVAKIIWTLIALGSLSLVTRLLGKEGFGEYTTILAFFFMFSSLSDLGLNQIVLREISRDDDPGREKRIVSTAFTLKIIISIIIILASFIIVPFLSYSDELKKGIQIVVLGLFFASSYQILTSIFQKRLLAYQVAMAELAGRVANLAWVFGAFYFKLGLLWILAGMIMSWATTFLIVFVLARKQIKFKLSFDYKQYKKLLKQSLPLGLSAIITFMYFRCDTILLSLIKGPADVGIYGAGYKIIENIAYFPAMFMGLIMPLFAKNVFKDKEKFNKLANRVFDSISLIAVGISFGVFALADKIILVIAGPDFAESVIVLKILSLAIIGLFYAQYFNTILIAANLQKKLLLVFSFCAVLNISLNLIFIPKYSYLAAGVISSATEIIVPILSGYLVFRNNKYLPQIRSLLKTVLAGAIMAYFLMFFKEIPIFFQIPLGGSLYLLLAYMMRVFSKEEFRQIVQIRR